MNKEQILNAARKNKAKGEEFETIQSVKSTLLGTIIAIIVGSALFLIELFVGNRINFALISVVTTTAGTQWLYEGLKLKKPILTIFSIIFLLAAVFTFIAVVAEVVAK